MKLYENLINKNAKLSVIGLGYVGMPLAVAFSDKIDVIGYDINAEKIKQYENGVDPTREVGDDVIKEAPIQYTSKAEDLQDAQFHVVSVPTPINQDKTPDLTPITSATKTIGENLTKGSFVVYESTVYPGATEDICVPLLEEYSGLKHEEDFFVGYSPERINPGDKVNTLDKIVKIVSSTSGDATEEMAKVYELVIDAGVHRAPNIKVAEAAKVVENSQRDVNIAFMNELAVVFDLMEIDSKDVVEAMNTKWNALGFTPGLVGGHCIGVDPYYFIYEAENLGYHSQIISAGRDINDGMSRYISEKIIKELVMAGKKVIDAEIAILGLTFKPHTPDTRNTRVIDIIRDLEELGLKPKVVDPWADPEAVKVEYGRELSTIEDISNMDCLVFAVEHDEFVSMAAEEIESMFNQDLPNPERVIIDVKSILDKNYFVDKDYRYWRL